MRKKYLYVLGVICLVAYGLLPRQTADAEIVFDHQVVDDGGLSDIFLKTVGDVNGDGQVDLVAGGNTSGGLVWYQSPTWTKHPIASGSGFSTDGEVVDMDGDGDQDVVVLTNGALRWYENPSWTVHLIDNRPLHDVEVSDLDGDGDVDLVARHQGDVGDELHFYRQDTPASWTYRRVICSEGEGLKVLDVDRDGDQDVVSGGAWFENTRDIVNGAWSQYPYTSSWTFPNTFVGGGDINQDGRVDIVLTPSEAGGQSYRISWFEAPMDPKSPNWTEHIVENNVEAVQHFVGVADMDNDGDQDIAAAEMEQGSDPDEVKLYLNGDGVGGSWVKQVLATTGSHSMRILDIGNDGDQDLFGANWEGNQVELWLNQTCQSTLNCAGSTIPKPGNPVLLSPANGALVDTLQPMLDWKDSAPAAHRYRIQVSTNNNFTGLVIDEASIFPSEFTFTFDLNRGKRYYWRVKAFNTLGQASSWSTVWNFRTPLDPPVLVSLLNGSSLLTDRTDFDWEEVTAATRYQIQVSASNTFGTLLVNATGKQTAYSVTQDLPQNKVLYWRVRGKTSVVAGAWSEVWSFTTGNPPSVPVLAAPANNALVRDYTPLLNWNNSTLPLPVGSTTFKHYQIQVDDHNDFSSPLIDETTTEGDISRSDFTSATDLPFNLKFYWRVRAFSIFAGNEHFSAWSAVRSFRTALLPPTLVSPEDAFVSLQPRPPFDWGDVPGASGYTIQISKNNTFTQIVQKADPVASQYRPAADLPKNLTLYWRVRTRGVNGPSAWSEVRSLHSPNSPSTPVLSSPAKNALNTNYTPRFKWKPVTLPSGTTFQHYQLQVDHNADFASPVIDDISSTDRLITQFQVSVPLASNTKFYWRVRAVNTANEVSNWSAVWYIRTRVEAPILLSPENGAAAGTRRPTFDWNDANGPGLVKNYTIQVSASPNFGTLLVNSNPVNSEYAMPKRLPAGKTLYWRVRVNGANGPSAWSTVFSFTTP